MNDFFHDVFTNNPHNDFTNIGIKDLEEIFLVFFGLHSYPLIKNGSLWGQSKVKWGQKFRIYF